MRTTHTLVTTAHWWLRVGVELCGVNDMSGVRSFSQDKGFLQHYMGIGQYGVLWLLCAGQRADPCVPVHTRRPAHQNIL